MEWQKLTEHSANLRLSGSDNQTGLKCGRNSGKRDGGGALNIREDRKSTFDPSLVCEKDKNDVMGTTDNCLFLSSTTSK